jgi:hypothetical protein
VCVYAKLPSRLERFKTKVNNKFIFLVGTLFAIFLLYTAWQKECQSQKEKGGLLEESSLRAPLPPLYRLNRTLFPRNKYLLKTFALNYLPIALPERTAPPAQLNIENIQLRTVYPEQSPGLSHNLIRIGLSNRSTHTPLPFSRCISGLSFGLGSKEIILHSSG